MAANQKSIIWLASYPKSGNTWTRVFLANYIFDRKEPMPINQVHRLGIGDSVEKTYRMAAQASGQPFVNMADYRQTLALRAPVLRAIVNNDADVNFVKTHNRRTKAFGIELIPPALTRSAIYILRNPLDMVPSYARHFGLTHEETVAAIRRSDNSTAGAGGTAAQFLGTWSEHVQSWARCRDFPVLVLRYEDLQADPAAAFTQVLKHIGVPPDPERVARAIEFSSFDELRRQEDEHDFVERVSSERFFHSGQSGRWREGKWEGALDPDLADRICRDHAKVMGRHGYLPGDGT
ncbi:MAG: sulfotransferase domain-containing protein [Paracoccaceae bacterium]|nr:sulfotransferase domain-containing protein [Paracoccaceae bacterium]